MDSRFKENSEQIERPAATFILTPFATAVARNRRVHVVKCVGEDNVIDLLRRWLKQKRSQVHKRAIFFMNRENEIESAIALLQADFHQSRSLALGAVV
jgi:hypothetical protein